MATDVNLGNVTTGTAGTVQTGDVGSVGADAAAQTPSAAPILPDPSVTVTTYSEMERMVMEAEYETAANTIKNLVDTPEERAEKAQRAKERRQAEDEADRREDAERAQEAEDARVDAARALDEIQTKRRENV